MLKNANKRPFFFENNPFKKKKENYFYRIPLRREKEIPLEYLMVLVA
ncbi:hypothetical protein CTO_0965 [Chlamydia trachomatis A2497]|uniref:Uncharacterized protein n=1 Tax=Chlamydia trachomatis serovar A (strain A2497) TaxID=580047 RepID=G4NMC6_CHLT4|nr:hypothetical protein CTL2C_221 [Chlamydia trachomatis L2c]AEP35120.1 hypothetical protein CTO_0965 [Chlamydia trachomatis A2497]